MTTLFLICAVIGGTVLFFQLALMLIGLGGEALDADVPGDVDGSLDVDMDVDVDVDMDVDVDVDADMDVDVDAGGIDGADTVDDLGHVDHPDTVSAFRVLSFRTIVAALTFFGLGGLAAQAADFSGPLVPVVAVAAGAGAMYAVYWLFRGMRKLQADGTVRIRLAVGQPATVYVPIPGNNSGTGKIQLNLQNRTMEYLAMTPGEKLSTGAKVVVTGVITSDTLEVELVPEPERSDHA